MDSVAVDEAQYRIQEESNRFRLPASVVDSDAPDASHLSKRHRTENGGTSQLQDKLEIDLRAETLLLQVESLW